MIHACNWCGKDRKGPKCEYCGTVYPKGAYTGHRTRIKPPEDWQNEEPEPYNDPEEEDQ